MGSSDTQIKLKKPWSARQLYLCLNVAFDMVAPRDWFAKTLPFAVLCIDISQARSGSGIPNSCPILVSVYASSFFISLWQATKKFGSGYYFLWYILSANYCFNLNVQVPISPFTVILPDIKQLFGYRLHESMLSRLMKYLICFVIWVFNVFLNSIFLVFIFMCHENQSDLSRLFSCC